jgi:Heavy metal associated domain 2
MTNSMAMVRARNGMAENVDLQVGEFLREHNEVEMILPVLLGLFITSRFQLRGANALLVNLAVASVSRQLFQQLKALPGEKVPPVAPTAIAGSTEILPGCRIVHSVAGRVRLRIDRLAEDPVFAKRLDTFLKDDPYVIGVRVNRAAASVAIAYESDGLSEMELGLRLLNLLDRANAEVA